MPNIVIEDIVTNEVVTGQFISYKCQYCDRITRILRDCEKHEEVCPERVEE